MSRSERCVQDLWRRQTDRAINRACALLASDPLSFTKFQELLFCVRRLAPRVFEASAIDDGRHLGVEALFHLARFRDAHIRSAADWVGTSSSWRPAVSSLAQHLTCRYRIPPFMSSVWHGDDAAGDTKRCWVIEHARGASFRSLDLPITMTRKMEQIFLASRDHLTVESALRRAELLAYGMPAEFIKAIMLTPLAKDLRNGDFWRTVWMFFVTHADEIEPPQIGPMIDYIQSVRHDRMRTETQDGVVELIPPQPNFSVKGCTVSSLSRLMREWHRSLASRGGSTLSWARSPVNPWLFEEPRQDDIAIPKRWHMMELTSSTQLREEGIALHHCVASYAYHCHRGTSSIWSLRVLQGEKARFVLTVEVDPKKRAVIQARGRANRSPSGKSLKILRRWAVREGLQMAI